MTNNSRLKKQLNKLHLGKFAYAACFFKALKRQKTFELTVASPNFPTKIFHMHFCVRSLINPILAVASPSFPKLD